MAYGLLNSIAKDLDCMLVDLCQTLPDADPHHEQSLSRLGIPFAAAPGAQRRWPPVAIPRRGCLSEQPVPRLASSRSSQQQDAASLDRALDRRHQRQQQQRHPINGVAVLPVNDSGTTTTTTSDRRLSPAGQAAISTFSLPASAVRLHGLAARPLSADDERCAGVGASVGAMTAAAAGQEPSSWPNHFDGYHNDIPLEPRTGAADGSSWDTASESNGGESGSEERGCHISVLERLIHTHPIWFLRGIYRAGAVHLLQGKEVGNFIIRQSSQTNTMAITVRLPPDKGPYIEHYLIEAINGKLRLEGSDNHFQAIPTLVAHYCQCCDELPVQLTLPRNIAEARGKQELSSLALLGQEFWTHSLGSPTGHWNTGSPTGSGGNGKPPKPVMPLPISIPPRPHLSTFSSPSTSPTVDPQTPPIPSPSLNAASNGNANNTPPSGGGSEAAGKRTNRRPPPPPRWYTPTPGSAPSSSTSKDCESLSNDNSPCEPEHPVGAAVENASEQIDQQSFGKDERRASSGMVLPLTTPNSTSTTAAPPVAATRTLFNRAAVVEGAASPEDLSIESPPGCNFSSLADKVSDYEDLWAGSSSPGLSSPDDPPAATTNLPGASSKPAISASGGEIGGKQSVIPPDQDELEIVKALKGIRMSGGSTPPPPLVAARSWEYITSANQTDQQKVLARRSFSRSEGSDARPSASGGVPQSPQLVRRALEQMKSKSSSSVGVKTKNGDDCDRPPSHNRLTNGASEPETTDKSTSGAAKRRVATLDRLTSHRHSDPSARLSGRTTEAAATTSTSNSTTTTTFTSTTKVTTSKTVSESRIYEVNGGGGDLGLRWKLPGLAKAMPSSINGNHHHNVSSSLTDIHSPVASAASTAEVGGGFVNVGFKSSSSQLLAARCADGDASSPGGTHVSNAASSERGATLPRVSTASTANNNEEGRNLLLRECFDGFQDANSTPNSTLRRKKAPPGGKSYNESVWPLDSSWEFRSRNGGPLSSSSDSDSPSELDFEEEEDCLLPDGGNRTDEEGLVQLRNKDGGGHNGHNGASSRFPIFLRPPGNYILNSFLSHSGDSSAMTVTVEDLLTRKQPQLRVPEIKPLTASNLLRVSAYDNLGSDDDDDDRDRIRRRDKRVAAAESSTGGSSAVAASLETRETSSSLGGGGDDEILRSLPRVHALTSNGLTNGNEALSSGLGHRLHKPTLRPTAGSRQRQVPSETGSSATEFSEPWDSSRWERLLLQAAVVQGQQPKSAVTQEQTTPTPRRKEDCRMLGATEVVTAVTTNPSAANNNNNNNNNSGGLRAARMDADEGREPLVTDGGSVGGNGGAGNDERLYGGSSLDMRGLLLNDSRHGSGEDCDASTTNDELQSVSTVTNELDDYGDFAQKRHNPFKKISALPCLLSLRRKDRHSGKSIRDYVFKMAQDKSLIFGQHIENFIQCTQESHEQDPRVVMRNIRQFMSGMANFLVNSGEGQFSALVQEERAKLRQTEFLNLDAILEGVLHKIVLRPLKQHICHLFVVEYTNNCAVTMLSDSIKFARTRTPEQLGIKSDLNPPHGETMELIKRYMAKLQRAYSPLKKLENLLAAISIIYQSILQSRGGEHQAVGADDFLPILTYVLVHCGLIAAEVEAEYMWGLLHPSLLSGEGGYYLTTLSSAVHVLKHLHKCHMEGSWPRSNFDGGSRGNDGARVALCLSELDGFMLVLIPNEQNGSIMSKTVPVRPNMTSKDICKMVAHRQSVTNPQDYALFKLVNGEEILLPDTSCPWAVKTELATAGVECTFAYKRIDAKMAWPVKPIFP